MTPRPDHGLYKYSVTIHSGDLAVVGCLRALSQYSQKDGNNRIPWGGTKDSNWKRDGHAVTFRFTSPKYRTGFMQEAKRLLAEHLWKMAGISDNDPATPQ
jgi:hypothetical protein